MVGMAVRDKSRSKTKNTSSRAGEYVVLPPSSVSDKREEGTEPTVLTEGPNLLDDSAVPSSPPLAQTLVLMLLIQIVAFIASLYVYTFFEPAHPFWSRNFLFAFNLLGLAFGVWLFVERVMVPRWR